MKIATILTTTLAATFACLLALAVFSQNRLLDDHNGMASDNFRTALVIFKDGYSVNRILIFSEGDAVDSFQAGNIVFQVYPASQTTKHLGHDSMNTISNTASHLNRLVIMLSSKWIHDNDPAGDFLFSKLAEHLPNFKISAPGISPMSMKNIEKDGPLMDILLSQWQWRMDDAR